MGLAFVLIVTACGGEEPATDLATSGTPATTPTAADPDTATVTESSTTIPGADPATAPLAESSTTIGADPPSDDPAQQPSNSTTTIPGADPATAPLAESSTTIGADPPSDDPAQQPSNSTPTITSEPEMDVTSGCPLPVDPPAISRPVVDNNPNPAPAHLQNAVAPWPTDWSRSTIDLGELGLGIPDRDPRDLIPPLDKPVLVNVEEAGGWLSEQDPGMLVRIEDDARFYPLRVLTRHEVVNDHFGDRPVTVTYCPLCNTAIAFDPVVDGIYLRFGVSGLLRNSDLVLWDLETTSLWQQVTGEALVGKHAGATLPYLPSAIVAFSEFADAHPDGCVLGPEQAFGISYGVNPYAGYSTSSRPFLFNGVLDDRLPALSRVVGVNIGEQAKAYPFDDLATVRVINDTLGETPITVIWGAAHTADALDNSLIPNGRPIGTGVAFLTDTCKGPLTFAPAADDLFTDDQTNSTWNLLGQAIDGPLAGTQLEFAPHRNEFWFAWHAFFGAFGKLWGPSQQS